jgi:hypothetical protein
MSLGERRAFASQSPAPLWRLIWKVPDGGTLAAFLHHPKLSPESLIALIQAPMSAAQMEALSSAPWRELEPLVLQVLTILDETLRRPESPLVLGHAAPWIRGLDSESALVAATHIQHAPLRRMLRAWAGRQEAD